MLYFLKALFKFCVHGVVELGGHFAKLCQEVDFYKAFFFIINFQKEKANNFILLIILMVKRLQIEVRSTNLLLWPTICRNIRQSPQSTTTSRMLTLALLLIWLSKRLIKIQALVSIYNAKLETPILNDFVLRLRIW